MILSDALSRRPDHCPEIDNDNEDKILLPDDLFLNLLDLDLQERITKSMTKEIDFDVMDAMNSLLEKGPTNMRNDLEDWKLKGEEGNK